MFVITVPAYQSLYSTHDRLLGHHRRYSLTGLLRSVRQAGLEPLASGHVFLLPLLARAVGVLAECVKLVRPATATAVARWSQGPRLTTALSHILRADIALGLAFSRFSILPGLSCYVTCRTCG